MEKKGIVIGVCAAVLVVIGAGAMVFGPHIREAVSIARSASLDEDALSAKADENERIEQDIRNRYDIPAAQPDDALRAAIEDGSMTLEEAARQILENQTVPPSVEEEQPPAGGEASGWSGETGGLSSDESEPPADDEPPVRPSDDEPSGPDIVSGEEEPSGGDGAGESGGPLDSPPAEQPETSSETDEPSGPESVSGEEEPSGGGEEAPQMSEEELRLQNLITQMTLLRVTFTGRLDALIDRGVQEFLSLDPSEQTTANKMKIGAAMLKEGAAMEKECDGQVAAIVAQIRELDPDLASQVEQQYQNEKDMKKASLVAQYA